jgi:uncharacterized protein (TIGR02145 family)
MKKVITLLALLYISAFAQQKSTFTDTRDGKTYKATKIGEQVWMAENLNYEAERSRCYSDSISYCGKYGRLYDWATVMKACPKGWHLPSNAEWDKLLRFIDGTSSAESPYKSNTAGKHLKATSGWNDYNYKSIKSIMLPGNGDDKFGFSALPGGYGYSGGKLYGVGNSGFWWSSSQDNSGYAYYRYISYSNDYMRYANGDNDRLCSVRCVED